MAITALTKDNFEAEAVKSDKPVLIDFWATWCGPCRMLSPIVDEIAEERDDIKVCKVNVDEEGELAGMFRVASIPTLVLIKNHEIAAQTVGYMPKADVVSFIESAI